MRWKTIVPVLLLVLFSVQVFAKKPNEDKLAKQPKKQFRELTPAEKRLIKAGSKLHVEERLGVPTFVWAAPGASPGRTTPRRDPESEARRHFGKYASLYGLHGDDVAALVSAGKHDTGRGVVLVTLRPQVGEVEIFREEITIAMNQNLDLVAVSGYALGGERDRNPAADFALTSRDAVAGALRDLRGESIAPQDLLLTGVEEGGYTFVDVTPAVRAANPDVLLEPARAKKVYYRLPDQLAAAYYVEVNTSTTPAVDAEGVVADVTSDMYSYVISATTGEILFRNDLTAADSFSYRVWADAAGAFQPYPEPAGPSAYPHPTGVPDGFNPPFVQPNLVTLQNGPISTNDPWLPAGATLTNGNNVDAYADLTTPDGLSGTDFRANTTAPNTFDRTYDTSLQPNVNQEQQKASITQLFFMNNWLHDWYYDAGFDEASGNAQTENYGRGGIGNDRIRAEAQDFSGVNNANMSTGADGNRPRMQMFVFTGLAAKIVTNSQPAGGTIPPLLLNVGASSTFGAQLFNTTAEVVRANPTDGCTALAPIPGKIAFIDRGGVPVACGFAVKVQNAQAAGAVGVIMSNVADSANREVPPNMGGTCAPASACTIGTLSVGFTNGESFRSALALGAVNSTLVREVPLNRDGTIDNQIIAHEWGHYISNRLVHNASGLVNQMGRGMGEGWGDFHALLLTVRAEDASVPSNANWNGVFAMSGYATVAITPVQNYYFGIRRIPYSTDFTKNAFTYKHIQNGVPLPPVPTFANANANSEVHNAGEIWATMLWESYAALLRDTQGPAPRLTFEQAQDRMKRYIVAGYKLTPVAPTLLEARDAILTAAYANDAVDGHRICEAFARRGAGIGAVAPDRFSTTLVGVVESYVCANDLAFQGAALTLGAQCDNDTFLDNRETGTVSLTVKNVGGSTLSHTTATLSSSNPAVSFPNGNTVIFAPVTPFTTGTASVDVGMFGAVGIQDVTLDIAFNDPDLSFGAPTASFDFRGNANDLPDSSATDDVESPVVSWTPGQNGTGGSPWQRSALSAFNHVWFGPNSGEAADQYLVSPVLNVAPSGSFSFSFSHRFSFEQSRFDGGVIELSTDNGATWTDIGASATPTYNGTLVATGVNPLRGRPAYLNASAGYPSFVNVNVNLGTAYAGQNVRIRFRVGSDADTASIGWEIDGISFQGITNTPFHTLVGDTGGSCANGRLIVRQVESLGAPNPTVNEWVELRNVSSTPLDLIGMRICDDQALAAPAACDSISGHQVLAAGAGVVFAADRNIFLSMHPWYSGRVLDDASDSLLGVDGLDNNGDGVHLFEPGGAVSIDCMNYHNSSTCFAEGVVKDDGAMTMQRSISDPSPKLRPAWSRGPEVLP